MDQYLMYSSHHPVIHKVRVDRTLTGTTMSQPLKRTRPLSPSTSRMHLIPVMCGYPKWLIQRGQRKRQPRPRDPKEDKNKPLVVIPYVKGTSERIKRILEKRNLDVALRPAQTIRQSIVHPKDSIPTEDKAGVVYQVPCKSCSKCYIGETGRPLKKRISEHKAEVEKSLANRHFTRSARRDSQSLYHKSAITDHSMQENCDINWEGVKVLANDSNSTTRLIREALAIAQYPNFNRDQGNYGLPMVYQSLIGGAAKVRENQCSRLRKGTGISRNVSNKN